MQTYLAGYSYACAYPANMTIRFQKFALKPKTAQTKNQKATIIANPII